MPKKRKKVVEKKEPREPTGSSEDGIGRGPYSPPEPESIKETIVVEETPIKKSLPKIEPVVSIQPSRENDRKVSIEFIIHANKIKYEDIKDITFQILKDAVEGVISTIEEAVGQEQKFLDATRR